MAVGALAGVTVVEIGHSLAAPYAGMILASLGAEVIKIENVDGGDYAMWRKGLGTKYTAADFDTWRAHFGQTYTPGAGAGLSAVPEPGAWLLMCVGLGMLARMRVRYNALPALQG